jgi:hypothetical protein
MIFFPLCLYFFPLRPCNNCSFTDDVLAGKYEQVHIAAQQLVLVVGARLEVSDDWPTTDYYS